MPRFRSMLLPVVVGLTALAGPAMCAVQFPIQIDGLFGDWRNVLIDPENSLPDAGGFAGDPDNPNGDRDLRGFAWTWDGENLYFWFRRTLSGTNTISFYVYLDRDLDGLLSSNDRVLRVRFSGSAFQGGGLYLYDDGGTPDPITGDGVPEPGSLGSQVIGVTVAGAGEVSGIQLEASLPWAGLGLPPGAPMNFHVSAGLQNSIEDNMEAFDSLWSGVSLATGATRSGAPGVGIRFPHTIGNLGNATDAFDLRVEASQTWRHAIWSDPDGDGDPADGLLLAVDANGDGDYSDPFDLSPAPSCDANGNGVVDTGPLPPGGSWHFVLVVTSPPGSANGTVDDVLLVARSANTSSTFAENRDHAVAGWLTVWPDQSRSVPGEGPVFYPHRVCNETAFPLLANLEHQTSAGWAGTLLSDPDGDGDPSDGSPLADTDADGLPDLAVGAFACTPFVLRLDVPAGLPTGTVDSSLLTATEPGSGRTDSALDLTTVERAVLLEPDHAASAPSGGFVFYPHTLRNAQARTDSFDLTAFGTLGGDRSVFPDEDGDGIPDSPDPITLAGPVPAGGGTLGLVVRVAIPSTAVDGEIDVTALRAVSRSDPDVSAQASDVTRVSNVLTYSDPLFARAAVSFFAACSSVYALGSGLAVNNDFRFVWDDPYTIDGPERVSPSFAPDANGNVDDTLILDAGSLAGIWTVRIERRSGSSWVPLGSGGTQSFEVLADGGTVTRVQAGRAGYYLDAESISVSASLGNATSIDFLDSHIDYLVFRDTNSDGIPTQSEMAIRPDGSPFPWDTTFWTHSTPSVNVLAGMEYQDFWRITGVRFTQSGTWTIWASWQMGCGLEVAHLTAEISACSELPPSDAGPDRNVCVGSSTVLGSPGLPGTGYYWQPFDWLDDPFAPQPVCTPAAPADYTLVVWDEATGCWATSTVSLTVSEPPVASITADTLEIVRGGTAVLDAPAGPFACLWISAPPGAPGDGATTPSIQVSPATTTTYTVTLTDSMGCTASASLTITVLPLPPPPRIRIVLGGDTFCQRETVRLDAGPGYAAYLWETTPPGLPGDGAATRSIDVDPPVSANYKVTVSDSYAQEASDDVDLTVLTTTPGELGPSLRVLRAGPDVILRWEAIPDGWSYNTHRATIPDFSDGILRGSSDLDLEFTDAGAIDGYRLYFYQVRAKACFEGP